MNTPVDSAPDVAIVLPARPENVAIVRHILAAMGAALGMDAEAQAQLRLAASEACTNVVVHAYRSVAEGLLEVDAASDGSLLHVTVRDRGRGLRPRPDSPGLGLGLPLIAALTRSMEVGSPQDDSDGNEVRMAFLLTSPAVRDHA
ncbi:unannotated protein [freshwater metagenome]|uniref:Unannotated protein n=1 Tax=freshwater metagenome TaxID=449393 RepID=A0A6J7DDD2_9ZZZZ|nr:hypothetical protein [Actinomycetota bacterium]